jgi:transcription initiation factor TFIIB
MDVIWAQVDSFNSESSEPTYKDPHSIYFCQCGGQKMFDHAELPTCTSCGRVDAVFLSEEPEWTSGIDNDGNVSDPSRCGGPIDTGFFSASWSMGTKITAGYTATYAVKKMSRIHFHTSMNHKDRSLFHSYAEIEKACREHLGCNDIIIDAAKMMYRQFSEKKLTRGDVRTGVKANCVFLACKQFGYPRTTKEVADAFAINTKDIGRTADIVHVNVGSENRITMPKDVVVRIFRDLNIDDRKLKCQCIKFCERVERSPKLMGKTPSGIASAIIYIMLGPTVSKQDICAAAGVSIPTLNKMETTIRDMKIDLKQ